MDLPAFKRAVANLIDFLEKQLLPHAEQEEASRHGRSAEEFQGRGTEFVVEAQTRKHLIDPLLKVLGWNLEDPLNVLIEDGVEPQSNSGDSRRFLDYHGRASCSESRNSLLLVEAKRLSATLPAEGRRTPETLLAEALVKLHAGQPLRAGFPTQWRRWLETLSDYLERLQNRFGYLPRRAVITNGCWYVVFKDPGILLPGSDVSEGGIAVFGDLQQIYAEASVFTKLLGYATLSGELLPQHPAALADFLPEEGAASMIVALMVSRAALGEVEPVIGLRVVALMRTSMGQWITFRKDFARNYVQLHQDAERLREAHEQLNTSLQDLRQDLEAVAQVKWLTCAEVEGFSSEAKLCRTHGMREHLVITGGAASILGDNEAYDSCVFHDWGRCHQQGNGAEPRMIASPSVDPPAFFPSGSTHHCAHAAVQAKKRQRCVLIEIDGYLCCRRCIFFERCWGSDWGGLPCIAPN